MTKHRQTLQGSIDTDIAMKNTDEGEGGHQAEVMYDFVKHCSIMLCSCWQHVQSCLSASCNRLTSHSAKCNSAGVTKMDTAVVPSRRK